MYSWEAVLKSLAIAFWKRVSFSRIVRAIAIELVDPPLVACGCVPRRTAPSASLPKDDPGTCSLKLSQNALDRERSL